MGWQRLSEIGLSVAVILIGALVVVYAIRPSRHEPITSVHAQLTFTAQTVYAPVTPILTSTPTPTPDEQARIVNITSRAMTSLKVPAGYAVESILMDGTFYARNAQGRTVVFDRDGSVLVELATTTPSSSMLVSVDHRYVAWLAGDKLNVYDARDRTSSIGIPAAARFADTVARGELLIPDTSSRCDVVAGASACGTDLVDATGAVMHHFPYPMSLQRGNVSPSGRVLVWGAIDGVHTYDVAGDKESKYSTGSTIGSIFAWSPDLSEITYLRSEGEAQQVWRLSLGSGDVHKVYEVPADLRVDDLHFADAHDLQFELKPSALWRYLAEPLHGARYAINDDGDGGHYIDSPDRLWATCGPKCGMPPQGYEDGSGLAWWCEPQAGSCDLHLVRVDRALGLVHALLTTDDSDFRPSLAAESPNGRSVALVTNTREGVETLTVVDLADPKEENVFTLSLGFSLVPDVSWFPDAISVLLYNGAVPSN